jgi:RNA polymerase sigma-70 factor, ECF subfamily
MAAGGTEADRPASRLPVDDSTSLDDHALSRAIAMGDQQAFRFMVERDTPRIFRICYRILGHVDEAEEATQQAFVIAFRALRTYRGEGHAGAWLARIAARESWRLASHRSRRRTLTATLDVAIDVPGDGRDPLGEAIQVEERDRVRAAVQELPEPYREIITLRYFGDLSLLEICSATGRPKGTVKAQLHRGLARLRKMLGEGRG